MIYLLSILQMRKAIFQNKEGDDADYIYQKGDTKNSKVYFLEIWGRDRYNEPHHIRTLRIEGLVKATMNERVMATVRQDTSLKSYFVDLWDATDVVMDDMWFVLSVFKFNFHRSIRDPRILNILSLLYFLNWSLHFNVI